MDDAAQFWPIRKSIRFYSLVYLENMENDLSQPTCSTFAALALRVTAVENVMDPRRKWRRSERKWRHYQIRLLFQHLRQRSGFIDTPLGHLCFRVIVRAIDYNCHRPRSDQVAYSTTQPHLAPAVSASRAVFFQSLFPMDPSAACARRCLLQHTWFKWAGRYFISF